jgi:hypothetical protein
MENEKKGEEEYARVMPYRVQQRSGMIGGAVLERRCDVG